jgi:AcrR family transcriptional regulator
MCKLRKMSPASKAEPVLGELLARILAEGAPPSVDQGEGAAVAETSERILAAAAQQVEDFGLRRFTIDDVARRLRVSRVTIYRYFPKRDRLLQAVLLRELHRFLERVGAAVEPCPTLEEKLVEGVVFALGYLRRHRLLQRVLRTEPELLLPALTVRGGPVLAAGREFIAGFARAEAERGNLPLTESELDAVSELLARAVLSFLLTPESVIGMRSDQQVRAFAEHFLAPTLRALRSDR